MATIQSPSNPTPPVDPSVNLGNFSTEGELSIYVQDTHGKIEQMVAKKSLGFWDGLYGLFSSYKHVQLQGVSGGAYMRVSDLVQAFGWNKRAIREMGEQALGNSIVIKNVELQDAMRNQFDRTVSINLPNATGGMERLVGHTHVDEGELPQYKLVKLPDYPKPILMKASQLAALLDMPEVELRDLASHHVGALIAQKKQEFEQTRTAPQQQERIAEMINSLVLDAGALRYTQVNAELRQALGRIGKIVTVDQFNQAMTRLAQKVKPQLILGTLLALGRELATYSGRGTVHAEARREESLGFVITDGEVYFQGAALDAGTFKQVSTSYALHTADEFIWASVEDEESDSEASKPKTSSSTPSATGVRGWSNIYESLQEVLVRSPAALGPVTEEEPESDTVDRGTSVVSPAEGDSGTFVVSEPAAPAPASVGIGIGSPTPSTESEPSEEDSTLRVTPPASEGTADSDTVSSTGTLQVQLGAEGGEQFANAKPAIPPTGPAVQEPSPIGPAVQPPQAEYLPPTGEARREQEILGRLYKAKIPNVMTPYLVTVMVPSGLAAGAKKLVMIQKKLDGSLSGMLKANSGASLNNLLQAGEDVAEGLAGMHREGLVHMDIKPGNVLVQRQPDGTMRFKIHDYGTCQEAGKAIISGSPPYLPPAPEARMFPTGVVGEAQPAADSFALGVMLMEMVTGIPGMMIGVRYKLFNATDITQEQINAYIDSMKQKISALAGRPEFQADQAKALQILDLCKRLITRKPSVRLSCQDAFEEIKRIRSGAAPAVASA